MSWLPPGAEGSTVTVGTFDGVHLGHQAVIRAIAERARRAGRRSVLVTFDPHPLEVVNPAAAPARLTTAMERRELLAGTPLDWLVELRFDHGLAALGPEEFVREVLLAGCGMRELVIGYDHGFGRGRSGDADTLRQLGARLGFAVDVVAPVEGGGEPVSSTLARRAVAAGDLDGARRLLGRPYAISAQVGRGAGRGRGLGVPTINLAGVSARKLLPPDGVYAVRVEWRGGSAGGMMNQGGRPTFGEGERALEAHLFGVDADLYGEWVRLAWVRRLRDVTRFDSPAALRAQLDRDRAAAEAALADHDHLQRA